MKNYYIFLFAIFFSNQLLIAQNDNYIPKKNTQNSFIKLDFLSVELPNNQENLGLAGIHYNLFFNNSFYAGIGSYGAIKGNQGGFLTLGVNVGIKKYFSKKFYIDAGLHIGGGGNASFDDGGGAFILPHANLGFNLKHFSVNAGVSYMNFFDKGAIKDQQINFGIEIPLKFNYASYKSVEKELNEYEIKNSNWIENANRVSLMLHSNILKLSRKTKDLNGNSLSGNTINLGGIEIATRFKNNLITFLKLDGAYNGIDAGYSNILIGAGYAFNLNNKKNNIIAKLGLGSGGGGGLDTGSGFLLYQNIALEHKILESFYASLDTGILMTPNTKFYATSLGLGLKYYLNQSEDTKSSKNFKMAKFKGLEFIVKQDLYLNADRIAGFVTSPSKRFIEKNLYLISLQANLNFNDTFYLAGQTSFANFGDAGSYTEGGLGLGIKSPKFLNDSASIFGQILVAGAGGGNVDTGNGVILKPSIGAKFNLNNNFSLRSEVGLVRGAQSGIKTAFASIGINYNFSFFKMK